MSLSPNQRAKIKERDGNKCALCGSREQLTIDHIIPKSEGGTNAPDNLRTLCAPCNLRKANKPSWKKRLYNWLFSHKTLYEFKNEIRRDVATRNGVLLAEIKQLLEEEKAARTRAIELALLPVTEQRANELMKINKLAERIRGLQDYHKIEWVEETVGTEWIEDSITIKKYRKKTRRRTL